MAIKLNTKLPDYSKYYEVEKLNLGHIYHPCHEEIPDNAHGEMRGKLIITTIFVDVNLLHDLITGRSCTGIIYLFNKTAIDCFSKQQNNIESATNGSEFVTAACTAIDQIVDLWYTLHMLS